MSDHVTGLETRFSDAPGTAIGYAYRSQAYCSCGWRGPWRYGARCQQVAYQDKCDHIGSEVSQ